MLNDGTRHAALTNEHGSKSKAQSPEERKAAQAKWARDKRAAQRAEKETGMGAKSKKEPKAEKPAKEPKAPELPRNAKRVERIVEAALESGAIDAIDAAKRISKRYGLLKEATGHLKEVTTAAGLRLKAENEKFDAVITAPIEKGDTEAAVSKLANVTVGWQELGEVKKQNSEERSIAKEAKQKALKSFERSIEEFHQLTLPGISPD